MKRAALIFFLGILGICRAQTTSQLLNSLQKKNLSDSSRIRLYCQLSANYIQLNLDSNLYYSKQAVALIDTNKKDASYATAYTSIAKALFTRGEYNQSVPYYRSSLKVWEDLSYKDMAAETRLNLATCLTMKGDYAEAIENGLVAMRFFEEHKRAAMSGEANNLLGAIYYYKSDYENAIPHYLKAIDYFISADKLASTNNPYNNLAIIFLEQKEFKKAKEYFQKSLEACNKTGNKLGVIQVYNNLGLLHQKTGEWDQALKYLFYVLEYSKESKDKDDILISLFNIGEVYRGKKDYVKALEYFNTAKLVADSVGKKQVVAESYNNMGHVYYELGKYKEAAQQFSEYISLKDSLLNEENSNQINELKTKYETEKKEKDLEIANKENEKIALENKRQSLVLIAGTVVGALIFILLVFSIRAYRTKRKDNLLLSEQKKEIEEQKAIVDEKQKEIVDSINYALQIQKTLLANHDFVNQTIPDSFVLFKPKDIVSGDFYWATKKNDRFFLAVCDSTGHGVPGAFMSLLNISFLNEAVGEKNIVEPNNIFNHVRQRLVESISQSGRQDGMDGIIVSIDLKSNKITYAAANNEPVLISSGQLKVLEADKMPVGIGQKNDSFNIFSVDYKKGDMLYLCTDGYADQFGGEKGKKFKYRQLTEKLNRIYEKPVEEQKQILDKAFEDWKGNLEQVDDVTILGIRL